MENERKKKFSRRDKALLRAVKKAKRLISPYCSGDDSDTLCDAMFGARDLLEKVIKNLEPEYRG